MEAKTEVRMQFFEGDEVWRGETVLFSIRNFAKGLHAYADTERFDVRCCNDKVDQRAE
jgi:hypothetical protein